MQFLKNFDQSLESRIKNIPSIVVTLNLKVHLNEVIVNKCSTYLINTLSAFVNCPLVLLPLLFTCSLEDFSIPGTLPADGWLSVSEREREEVLGSRRGTGVGDTGRAPGTILGLKTLVRGAPKESETEVQ